ncbi:MAG: hypothetical protein GF329_17950 [Candidatus Lokiarchaeota archaeon]|nr:hypothetical protein [Candidatus Lokiarchaeota archaeon]
MNLKELFFSAMNGVPIKIPFNPFIMHLAASLLNIEYSVYVQKPDVLVRGQLKSSNFFGIEHLHVSTDAYREASAWGVEVDFSGHTPVAKPGSELDWREFDSIDTPSLLESKRILNRLKAVKLLKKRSGSDQCIIGWIEAPFAEINCIFGMTNVMKIPYHSWESIIKKLIDRIVPIQLEFAKLQIEAGADIIGAGDSAVSLIGPKKYEEACLLGTKKLFNQIEKKSPVLYHTCGDNSKTNNGRDMLKLIANAGSSIIDIDYQVDLAIAKSKIGNEICIRGNVNTNLLANSEISTEELIENMTTNIENGKPNGRYMFAAGCEWPWKLLNFAIRSLSLAKAVNEKIGYY